MLHLVAVCSSHCLMYDLQRKRLLIWMMTVMIQKRQELLVRKERGSTSNKTRLSWLVFLELRLSRINQDCQTYSTKYRICVNGKSKLYIISYTLIHKCLFIISQNYVHGCLLSFCVYRYFWGLNSVIAHFASHVLSPAKENIKHMKSLQFPCFILHFNPKHSLDIRSLSSLVRCKVQYE